MKKKILFITYTGHLNFDKPGGVQLCTKEYLDLLEAAGLDVFIFKVDSTKNIYKRLKARLNINFYDKFDFKYYAPQLISLIQSEDIRNIAINTIDLVAFSKYLKRGLSREVKIILLSHGNETGDLLPEIIRKKQNFISRYFNKFRLGALLFKESYYRNYYLDSVFCISELEVDIEKWLGAKEIKFIPRTYKKQFIEWNPKAKVIGYVGTLDHYPNFHGLSSYLNKITDTDITIKIIGGPEQTVNVLKTIYPNLDYLGSLSDVEMLAEMKTWCLFIHPIFYFARGASTKLATAINSGLPVVTTKFGTRGYSFPDNSILLANTPQEFADSVSKLLNSKGELNKLKSNAELIPERAENINQIALKISKDFL